MILFLKLRDQLVIGAYIFLLALKWEVNLMRE